MPRPGRTDLNGVRLLDPARGVGADRARTQRALDAIHQRITTETHDSEAHGSDTDDAEADHTGLTPDTTAAAARQPAPTGRRRHVRVGLVAAASLVIMVGVVVAVLAVRPATRSQPSVVPADLTLYASVIGLQPGTGFRVAGVDTAAGTQTADVVGTTDPDVQAQVTVSGTDSPPRTLVAGRAPVDLGHGVVAHWVSAGFSGLAGPPQADALSWDASGFTFDVHSPFGQADADAIAIAEAVRLVAPAPVRIPVAVSSLPTGWQMRGLTTIGVDAASTQNRFATVSIAVPGAVRPDGSSPTVDIDTRTLGLQGDDETGPPVDINGRTWRWNSNSDTLTWHAPDRVVSVGPTGSSGTPPVPPATLKAFVAQLSFASSFQDTATWFDAVTALPS